MKTLPHTAAFARPHSEDTSGEYPVMVNSSIGLTKREFFAAMGLQGILSERHDMDCKQAGELAVAYADALIEQLNREVPS